MTGLAPGPVAPLASCDSSVARLRALFGFSQVAPPSSPRTRTIWSLSGVRAPSACSAVMSWSALSCAFWVSLADPKAKSAITTMTPRTIKAVM